MEYRSIEKRLKAAHDILVSGSISRSTFDSLSTLLSGIHPAIDTRLGALAKAAKHADLFGKGDLLELSAEAIPETTETEKKRKKALLLFLKFWNDLKKEVARVEKEYDKDASHKQDHGTTLGNIFSVAKGPLGIVTVIAAALVALKITEVSIVITNRGCQPMTPMTSVAVNIPGLKLPADTIADGGSATAKLPPLSATIDATQADHVRMSVYGVHYDFSLGSSGIALVFDGQPLNEKTTNVQLGSRKEHSLVISCR